MPSLLYQLAEIQDGLFPFVILGVVILLIVAGLIVASRIEKNRIAALQSTAERLGMSFEPTGDRIMSAPFADFPLFKAGNSRRAARTASSVMSTADGDLFIFEYRYSTGSGKSRTTHWQTVAAIRIDPDRRRTSSPSGGLPHFRLSPEDMLNRIAQVFGYQDIDFDEWPDFSRKWLLRGADENAIRAFFDGRRLEALQNESPITIEAGGDWLLIYRFRTREKPDRIAEFIENAQRIAKILA